MTKKNKQKRGGYAGYYRGLYLRSSIEYTFVKYLEYKGINWRYEEKTYDLEGVNYKPDFFIYEGEELVKIIEIKGSRFIEEGLRKAKDLESKIGIPVKLYTEEDVRKIYRKEMEDNYHNVIEEWKETEGVTLGEYDMRGENNPMYGVKHSEETKRKISEKAKERFEDPNGKARITQTNKMIESNRKNNFDFLRGERVKRIKVKCEGCGEYFVKKETVDKRFCNFECFTKSDWNRKRMSKVFNKEILETKERRRSMKNTILMWTEENQERVVKIKLNDIKRNLKPLYDIIEEEYDVVDMRTINKSIFGEDRGRKEMVLYLKDYIHLLENICQTEAEKTVDSQYNIRN